MDEQVEHVKRVLQLFIEGLDDKWEAQGLSGSKRAQHPIMIDKLERGTRTKYQESSSYKSDLEYDSYHPDEGQHSANISRLSDSCHPEDKVSGGQGLAPELEEVAATELLNIAEEWDVRNVRRHSKAANANKVAAENARFRPQGGRSMAWITSTSIMQDGLHGNATGTLLSREKEATCTLLAEFFRSEGDKFDQSKASEFCMQFLDGMHNYSQVKQAFDLILPEAPPKRRMAALFSLAAVCTKLMDCTARYVADIIGVSRSLPDTVLF